VAKRKCKREGCETILSSYNEGEYCYAHTPGTPVYSYTCSKATHYKSEKDIKHPLKKERFVKPGDAAYNDLVFERTLIGFINEYGEFEEIDSLIGGQD